MESDTLKVINIKREEKDNSRMKVKSKGKNVGTVNFSKGNFRRIVLIGHSIILLVTGYAIGNISAKLAQQEKNTPEVNVSSTPLVPTYDGIPYYVGSYGSTLDGIIYGYVEDANELKKAKEEIMDLNGMDNTSIKYGDTILLCNVPQDKLEEYGYTVNYNYFDPSYEFEDRLAFLDKVIENVENDPDLKSEIESLHNMYRQYGYNYISEDQSSQVMDTMLEEIRDVCNDVEEDYYYKFDGIARPLSEATRNLETVKGMGL